MEFDTSDGPLSVQPAGLTIAGWTARDPAAVTHHIEELAAIGIPPPSKTPLFYRVGASLLTQDGQIDVLGTESSGEVEPVILRAQHRLWLGIGSDHTDRGLEKVSVAASKQACPKPVGGALWRLDEVADRLDSLELRAEIEEEGQWVTYQSGTLAAIRPLPDLVAATRLNEGDVLFCGTLGALGGVRPAAHFRATLSDPETGAELSLSYKAKPLPVVT